MLGILCRRRFRVPRKDCIFGGHQIWGKRNGFLVRSCSSSVCENASDKTLLSYLVNSCGLSSKEAITASKKIRFKSPQKSDAVLKLLRDYGFTDAHIPRIVTRWPDVLVACPNKTLYPKLEFLRSIGVPLPVLGRRLSIDPSVLMISLKDSIIPSYNDIKGLLQSDERVVHVFSRAPSVFVRSRSRSISANISMLREIGVLESSIVTLLMNQPSALMIARKKLAMYADQAVEMGFHTSRSTFVHGFRVFVESNESTLRYKMDVYRRYGWSETDIKSAFLRFPICMKFSEKKIMASMGFLVHECGYEPADVARSPVLIGFNIEKRMRPRRLVARILKEKGLFKKRPPSITNMFKLTEEKFLNRYIVRYVEDIPELLDIYRGKSTIQLLPLTQTQSRPALITSTTHENLS